LVEKAQVFLNLKTSTIVQW